MSRTRSGIDGLSSHLGFRWEAADRVRMTIRPDHISFSIFPQRRLKAVRQDGFNPPDPGREAAP